jgi:hypothetical protein
MFDAPSICPIGSVVIHKTKPEFGYGIVVDSFESLADLLPEEAPLEKDNFIAIILWHGDEEKELIHAPQLHSYKDLKVLNTKVGFA